MKRTRMLLCSAGRFMIPRGVGGLLWALAILGVGSVLCVPPVEAASYSQNGGTVTKSGQAYTSSTQDVSGVYVYNSGVFTLSDSTVTTSGNTSNNDSSSFYGLNAGVLAYNGTITLTDCTVTTSGTGANGVFAYGTGHVTMTGGTVNCTNNLGHAVMASGGGSLTVTNVNMDTKGTNSGAIATDRGGGTLTVSGGTVTTSGADSPGIYSTGTISVTGATISATGSEGAVIEGLNNVTLTNTTLSGNSSNYGGVLIVQTMSGDSEVGTANFTMTGGSLSAAAGPLFFVTNTEAVITLTGVTTSTVTGTLLTAQGTSRWGTSGSNGGDVTLIGDGQTLSGNMVVDSLSTLAVTLENGSALTGAIDAANTASSVTLSMDAASTWTVTANSYLASLSDAAGISGTSVTNITGNGYNVYYDSSASANSYLGAKTYSLVNGGKLLPEGTVVSQVLLTVAVSGRGEVVPSEGSHYYDEEAEVTLTATPKFGWEFVEWDGVDAVNDNPTTVIMTADKTVTAVFEKVDGLPVAHGIGYGILAGLVVAGYVLRAQRSFHFSVCAPLQGESHE